MNTNILNLPGNKTTLKIKFTIAFVKFLTFYVYNLVWSGFISIIQNPHAKLPSDL